MNVPSLLPNDTNNLSAPSGNTNANSSINMADPANLLATTTPNSKPRQQSATTLQTYLYQDFANAEPTALNTGTCHERVPPHSLQSQKLPSKLAAMLSDPDLASVITWMPHGRSWKIINRELFSTFALPRYFGHSNHASFVRIVNAWGFRRITKGPDRDSYYHELFLRGKPRLHERMKRLPTCHRKTPVDKEGKCPDFYELSKVSPLPASSHSSSSTTTQALSNASAMMNQVPAGFGNNPMASLGMGNPMLSQQSSQGNDMSSLLNMLRNQGTLQQQHQHQPQAASDNSMNQNLMQQLLRMQNINTPPGGIQSGSLGRGASAMGMGQFGTNFNQAPAPVPSSSNNQMLSSITAGMNMNGNQQARRLSNDKISVNDVIQLRSIEHTNEVLAQKLATMQAATNTMKQNSSPGISAASGNSMPAMGASGLMASTSSTSQSAGNSAAGGPSKEEMLLQMIRSQNQVNAGASAAAMQNRPVSNSMEDNANMSAGLNNFLKSLTGMQQQR